MCNSIVILLKLSEQALPLDDMYIVILFAEAPKTVRHPVHGEQIIFVFVKRSLPRSSLIDFLPKSAGQSFP